MKTFESKKIKKNVENSVLTELLVWAGYKEKDIIKARDMAVDWAQKVVIDFEDKESFESLMFRIKKEVKK